jgi:hypothetical protein
VRRFAPQLFAQLFCFPLLLLLVSNSQGQYPIKPSTGRQVIEHHDLIFPEIRQETNPQYQLLAELNLRADFRKIQVLNIDLLKRVFRPSPATTDELNQKEIRSNLGEIKKLATRLRMNLGVPKIDKTRSIYEVKFAPGVLLLDKAITSFVENPLFQQPRVVDTELAMRAGKDLNEVVQLSEFLRKLAKEN